jgi:hypothetical protein
MSEIDWPLMRKKYWHDTDEDGESKTPKQAEFLVLDSCPGSLLDEVVVCDQNAKNEVLNQLSGESARRT